MDLKLFNEKITENNYKDFVEKIIHIFRLSNYDKYLMLALKIEKATCIMKLSILSSNGDCQIFDEIRMDCDERYFYDFLKYLVVSIRDNCDISMEDIVNLDDDHFVAYRMITTHNDLVTIDGLTEKQANQLLPETPNVELSISNNTGGSSILGFIFMIVSLILSIITVICLVD